MLEASLRVSGDANGATPVTQSSSLSPSPRPASRIPSNSCSSNADSSSHVIAGECSRAWCRKSKGGSGEAAGVHVNEVSSRSLCGGVASRLLLLEADRGVLVTGEILGGVRPVGVVGCEDGDERKQDGVRSVWVSASGVDAVLRRLVGLFPWLLWGFLGPGLSSTCHLGECEGARLSVSSSGGGPGVRRVCTRV